MPKVKPKGKDIRVRMATPKENAEREKLLDKLRKEYLDRMESELKTINRWSWKLLKELQAIKQAIS